MEEAVKGKAKRRHLSAEELGQSTEGTNALTLPHMFNWGQGNRDPNKGLYPRTPTKKRKPASASASPVGKQRSIGEFFSKSGVVSSSPHKSPQPSCSSTCPNRFNGELFPRDRSKNVEYDNDDDEDDDVSLLAPMMAPAPQTKMEQELDDASLLAAAMVSDPEVKEVEEMDDASMLAAVLASEPGDDEEEEEEEVDHLQGVTAEMFGVDDDFDKSVADASSLPLSNNEEEEEEVEALPDSCYGLLGDRKDLQQPQGCIDDLPEEVLRQILCLLPARDLYRSVSLVCHHWWNIVEDPQFVPFKKKYYRYMMREKEAKEEVGTLLKNSGITDPALSQHSIRHLVVLMAGHKVRERVSPEDVLERVKKHRLFPQAEASIRLRIPDIQKYFNLGIEGCNPYAAMAVILILCENVGDVQALVSLLTCCMSHTGITEYLSHMAMMLLALKRNNIQINDRLHYNIYYVLHLMENGPFPVASSQSRHPQIQLTCEQQQILSHDIKEDHVVKIIAFAGTGKTSTLMKYAEQRPHLRFLYVAFNKSAAWEAERRFPRNVDCKTVHSLAFCDVGRRYRRKLTPNLKPFSISSALPEGHGGYTKAKVVTTTLNTYMASADPNITLSHVPSSRIINNGVKVDISYDHRLVYAQDAQDIWNKMKDLNERGHDAYYMTHDGYLKLWQLQNPRPCLSEQYDVLFIDEAQDCTAAIMDVLLSQRCGKILVGDPHQQIYTFRGAVNALNVVNHTHIFYLTQSFRFGAEIAYVGATILRVCKRVQKILVGGKQKGGVCDKTAVRASEALRTGVSHGRGKTAILARCNLSVFTIAVQLTDANPHCRIHFIGGVKNIGLNRIMDIWRLVQESGRASRGEEYRPKFIKDPLIRSFAKRKATAIWALKKYIDQTEDLELSGKLSIVEKYGSRIPELVKRMERCFEYDPYSSDFMLGTVHKAKGLEFDTVMITDDFIKVPCSKHKLRHNPNFSFSRVADDEWNLLYVAATRAKNSLMVTKSILRILTMAGEYLLKSEMPNSLMKAGEVLPCSIPNCPNCITPGSAFIMCTKEISYTDGKLNGGPLCERCVWTRIGPTAFLMTDDVLSMAEIPEGFF